MAKEKSLVEEAIIQMKNLEEAVAENAKGILASTMKQEIKDLVKESLSEQDDEIEIDDVEMEDPMGSDDIADMDMGDDSDEEGDEMDTDDMDDTEDDGDDEEEDMDFDDEEDMDDDEDTIDLTDADDEEVLRVFQLMGPDDNIVVTKDDKGNTHLKDEETGKEYMIVGESEENEEWSEEVDEMWGGNEHDFKRRDGHKIGDVDGHYKDFELDEDDMGMNGETIEDIVDRMFSDSEDGDEIDADDVDFDLEEELMYEIEMDEDDSEYLDMEEDDSEYLDMEEQVEDPVMESKKMSIKGVGMGNPNKKKVYSNKPNQEGGFETKMKQGPRTMGTGKAKFDYKDGENAGSKLGKNKMVKKVESKEGIEKPVVKKSETKEAVRTLGAGSNFRKGGLPKPRAHSSFNTAIKEDTSNKELQILREKNEEYRKALNVFRSKLNEVAVFNSNLAYATRLFTEHSTSKQEKINILRRFDGVETIKESKNLYQVVKNELSAGTKSQSMNESIERTIAKSPSTGAVNLIESKTYENPQFLRMKDLMTKIK
jgi:hypothetical protein